MLYVGLALLGISLVLFLMWCASNDSIYSSLAIFFAATGLFTLVCLGMFRLGQQSILIDQQLEQQKIERQALIEELNLTPEQVELIRK